MEIPNVRVPSIKLATIARLWRGRTRGLCLRTSARVRSFVCVCVKVDTEHGKIQLDKQRFESERGVFLRVLIAFCTLRTGNSVRNKICLLRLKTTATKTTAEEELATCG